MKALLHAVPYGVILLAFALPAPRALATITGSGEVRILVDDPQLGFVTKSPGIVEPDDEIHEIEIGDPGPLGEREVGALTLTGEGDGSRIDVAGDALLRFFAVLNVEDGGVVDVDGTLTIEAGTTVNLNGGTLRVGALVEDGTLVENGGLLLVPEAGPAASGAAAVGTLAWRARRRGA